MVLRSWRPFLPLLPLLLLLLAGKLTKPQVSRWQTHQGDESSSGRKDCQKSQVNGWTAIYHHRVDDDGVWEKSRCGNLVKLVDC